MKGMEVDYLVYYQNTPDQNTRFQNPPKNFLYFCYLLMYLKK